MVMYKLFSRVTPLVAFAALLGCASDAVDEPEPRRIELLTWWTEPTEIDAIDALVAVHRQRNPGAEVSVLSTANHETLVVDMQNRFAEGNPPAAFQENLGGNALRWSSSAQSLESRSGGWSSAFQPALLDLVTVNEVLIGVPVAITRQNDAYYNQAVLDDLGLSIPEGNDAFLSWLAELAERGYTHPLCAGDTQSWVSAHVLFEDIVPAHAGAAFSQSYWAGLLEAATAEFLAALGFAASIVPYFNEELLTRLDMAPGVERLMLESTPAEQCVMAPMGDWGGAILSARYEVERDFVQRPWPGTEQMFVLNGDAFIAAKNQQETFDFFDTVASREGQIAFSARKGSVPARTMDAGDFASFGALTQDNMVDLASNTVLPGFKVIGRGQFPWDALNLVVHDFFLTGDATPIVEFMNDNYDKLRVSDLE
jgi:glucose/mannose transport system substrate-binding protein